MLTTKLFKIEKENLCLYTYVRTHTVYMSRLCLDMKPHILKSSGLGSAFPLCYKSNDLSLPSLALLDILYQIQHFSLR